MLVVHLVFHLRPSRDKARAAAVAEALALLHDLEPSAPAGGPCLIAASLVVSGSHPCASMAASHPGDALACPLS